MFCNHELQREFQRNRRLSPEKSRQNGLKMKFTWSILVVFGLVSMDTCFCGHGGQQTDSSGMCSPSCVKSKS